MKIIEGSFDPITKAALQRILQEKKQYHDIYIKVQQQGILEKEAREKLLVEAIRPYRHLHLYTGKKSGDSLQVVEEEKAARSGMFYKVPKASCRMMIEKGYYFEEIVKNCCNERRAAHSFRVADTAVKLAKMHHLDPMIAYKAGLLHDITKRWSDIEGEKLLQIYAPDCLAYDPKVWHSFTAPIIIQTQMHMHDKRILNAIWHHTLGDGNTDWDHILYIADKIEPGRGYDASYELSLAKKSLSLAADYVLQKSKAYILEKEGKHV